MAKKTTRHVTYTYTARSWMFPLSFWLVVFIGAAMALVAIMHLINVTAFDSAANWIKSICTALALIIPVVMSYQVARHKGTVWMVLWVIFVILIVFGVILAPMPF